MVCKRKRVTQLAIVPVVFGFASVTLAAGFMNVITPETARMPALVPPQTTAPTLQPAADYPLALNNTWVYESTRYDGFNPRDIMTATQIVTETVIEIKNDPSFVAAKIRQETSADRPVSVPKGWEDMLRPASTVEYWLVVQDNRIYRQERDPDPTNLQDPDSLELVFPFQPGDQWNWLPARLPTEPQTGGIARQVVRTGTVVVPAGQFDHCSLIKEDWADSTVEDWFCPGVGWVVRKSDHNGTPVGRHWVLVRHASQTSSPSVPREILDRLMQARIDGQDRLVLDLLTDDLAARLYNRSDDVWLYQASNPCWYRYLVVQFEQTTPTQAHGRVRVYMHDWAGDVAGGPPQSWEQTIGLVERDVGWRVDQMEPFENRRAEPSEPHGPTLSACTAWR
jgi:hypothetical protein